MRALRLALVFVASFGWTGRALCAATPPEHLLPAAEALAQGSPVPEPSTLLLVGTGLVGVALTTRLRRRPR